MGGFLCVRPQNVQRARNGLPASDALPRVALKQWQRDMVLWDTQVQAKQSLTTTRLRSVTALCGSGSPSPTPSRAP